MVFKIWNPHDPTVLSGGSARWKMFYTGSRLVTSCHQQALCEFSPCRWAGYVSPSYLKACSRQCVLGYWIACGPFGLFPGGLCALTFATSSVVIRVFKRGVQWKSLQVPSLGWQWIPDSSLVPGFSQDAGVHAEALMPVLTPSASLASLYGYVGQCPGAAVSPFS